MITPSFALTATERVLPRLALDFTTASLDSRVTFTRAGDTATVTNSSGYVTAINANLPRFDYDPITLVCKGLLIEETRTNLIQQSEALATSPWGKITAAGLAVTNNIGTSPAGVQTAALLDDLAVAATLHGVQQLYTLTASTTYTLSCYAKDIDRQYFTLSLTTVNSNYASVEFNLASTGSVNRTSALGTGYAVVSSSITPTNDGWFRCTATITTGSATVTDSRVSVALSDGTSAFGSRGAVIYTGSNKQMYIWGVQIETGAFATSYIPTTTTALTRNADVATMTGTNFSNWYNAVEGGFAFSYAMVGVKSSASQRVVQIDDGTETSRFGNFLTSINNIQISITNPSGVNGAINPDPNIAVTPNTRINQGFAYKLNNAQGSANANLGIVDTTVDIPTINTLRIAQQANGTVSSNLWLQNLYYWPQRITGAELQAFTK